MNTSAPDGFESGEEYSIYRLSGHGSLPEAAKKVVEAITYCKEQGKGRLLVDVTKWTGHARPTVGERFDFAQLFAQAAGPAVKCALVVRPELMDPEKFEVIVASNRGMMGNVFDSEKEAAEWLVGTKTD